MYRSYPSALPSGEGWGEGEGGGQVRRQTACARISRLTPSPSPLRGDGLFCTIFRGGKREQSPCIFSAIPTDQALAPHHDPTKRAPRRRRPPATGHFTGAVDVRSAPPAWDRPWDPRPGHVPPAHDPARSARAHALHPLRHVVLPLSTWVARCPTSGGRARWGLWIAYDSGASYDRMSKPSGLSRSCRWPIGAWDVAWSNPPEAREAFLLRCLVLSWEPNPSSLSRSPP